MFEGGGCGYQGGGTRLVEEALKEMKEVGVVHDALQRDTISYGVLLQVIESLSLECGYYGNISTQKNK